MSFITGVGLTSYGKHEGSSSLDLMSQAAQLAITDAGLKRSEIDGVLCGYSTVSPHIMLATVFAEHFGIKPAYAHAVQVGGATGLAMTMLAHHLVEAGIVKHVLVVGGENRLTGQSRDASILALAQVGHPDYEVPLGPTIPAYYGLVASRYMHEYGVTQEDLAEFAVLMREPRADPSRRAVSRRHHRRRRDGVEAGGDAAKTAGLLSGVGRRRGVRDQPRTHRRGRRARARLRAGAYPSAYHGGARLERTRRRDCDCARRKQAAGVAISDVRYAAVYDSFTITLAMLLEDLGLAGRGEAAARVRSGHFGRDGAMPLNTHGGLLSYGHCGVGGAMAHLVETHLQMTGRAEQPSGARCLGRAAAWRRRRAVVACQHVPGAGAMSEKTRRLDHGRGSHRLSILRRPAAACNISAAASASPAARRIRWRSAPAARARSTPPRWCAAPRRPKPGRMFPTTSCWSIPSEGFRMMAHGDNDLSIGDKVTARFVPFAGRLVPYFEKVK